MAARFKKRPPGSVNNKFINLETLTIYDLICPICQSIYIEPVTLPCFHHFCLSCFNGSVENNALACPLCRTRIGSWLRKTSKQNKLVNSKLWEYIKSNYQNEINNKLNGGDLTILKEDNTRKLSAAGEIRLEYENEIERLRRERQCIQEKHSKESEKLIRELQEQDRIRSEEQEAKLLQDELLAKQLAEESQRQRDAAINKNHHSQTNGKSVVASSNGSRSNGNKEFYAYQSSSGTSKPDKNRKSNTLDKYVIKTNGTANGHVEESTMGSPLSPELISTAGRCGRFLKNFLTVRLWGSSITGCPNSNKVEPKVWEPQDTCAGHSRELSVNTGVEQHHQLPPGTSHSQRPKQQLSMDDSITEETIIADTVSEDSLSQELCYFKPLHPEPNMFTGKLRRCIPKRPSQKPINDGMASQIGSPDLCIVLGGLEKLKGSEFWKKTSSSSSPSSFVCLVQVPLQILKAHESFKSSDKTPTVMKPNKKTIKRKYSPVKTAAQSRSPTKSTTPKKSSKRPQTERNSKRSNRLSNESGSKDTSPWKHVSNQNNLSRSCVKLGSNDCNPDDHVLTRSKRSISFGDAPSNGSINGKIDWNVRTLRSNGLISKTNSCDMLKLSNVAARKMSSNDEIATLACNNNYKSCVRNKVTTSAKSCVNGFVFDASIVKEQKRIEEMIAQEKKDFALAKKLQKQFCGGDYVSTGYTVRTAAKKQASLRDILPVAKKMRV